MSDGLTLADVERWSRAAKLPKRAPADFPHGAQAWELVLQLHELSKGARPVELPKGARTVGATLRHMATHNPRALAALAGAELAAVAAVVNATNAPAKAASKSGGRSRADREAARMQPHWQAWREALTAAARVELRSGGYNTQTKRWRRHAVARIEAAALAWMRLNERVAAEATCYTPPKHVTKEALAALI